jgi:hypothetical protein
VTVTTDSHLTDEQVELLVAELDRIIAGDRYPLSARIRALREIRAAEASPRTPADATASEVIRAAVSIPLQETQVKPYSGPPATLGDAASAHVRLVVWCRDCQHRVEPDPADHAARYGADPAVIDWVKRLKCSQCGSRSVDFVLTGAGR